MVLGALAGLQAWQLYQAWLPTCDSARYNLEHHRSNVTYSVLRALAANEDALTLEMLTTSQSPNDKMLSRLLRGKEESARLLLESWGCSERQDPKSAFINEFSALLNKDAPALRKNILKMVRADRAGYEQQGTLIDPCCVGFLHLAHQLKIEIEPIRTVETLGGDLYLQPVDKWKWKLPCLDDNLLKSVLLV